MLFDVCVVYFPATGTFSCTLKYIVKDCDPNTGEVDEPGYEDEYVVGIRLRQNKPTCTHKSVGEILSQGLDVEQPNSVQSPCIMNLAVH